MAKYVGDIPCVNLGGIIHITTSATKCLCGKEWHYGSLNYNGKKFSNIIWRSLNAVSCKDCKDQYRAENNEEGL